MQQNVTIAKVAGFMAEKFLRDLQNGKSVLQVKEELLKNRNTPPVLYYCDYNDRLSMGFVFDMFLYPKKSLLSFDSGTEILFCIDSKLLKIKKCWRFEFSEEKWLYTHLKFAKKYYSKIKCKSYIFIFRSINDDIDEVLEDWDGSEESMGEYEYANPDPILVEAVDMLNSELNMQTKAEGCPIRHKQKKKNE